MSDPVDRESFESDPHAARYLRALDARRDARDRFFEILNHPCSPHRLEDAEDLDRPAIDGIVRFLDADDVLQPVLAEDLRFRQAVGVGVRLMMESLGWVTTGRKGPVRSANFTRAERYVRDGAEPVRVSSPPRASRSRSSA